LDEYHRTAAKLAEAEARRTGRDPSDLAVRVFVGALAGGMMTALDGHPSGLADRVYQTLDYMEFGMPFT